MDAKNAPGRAKARAPRRQELAKIAPFVADANSDAKSDDAPAERVPVATPRVFTAADRAAVVQKLWESAERQVVDLHGRVMSAGLDADERERDGRVLAVMVKTMRELAALDEATLASHDDASEQGDRRDIDEFRRELARRIDALVAAQPGEAEGKEAGA
jgi:hypothetical protein